MLAAGAMQAAGSIYGGLQANAQGKYESAVARNNAQLEIENAHESERMGGDERRKYWRGVSDTKGQQIASMSANGIDVGYGSAQRVQDDTAMLAGEDAANLNRSISARTQGHQINAGNFVAEAKAAKARGKAALVGSVINAGATLLGSAQQFKSIKAKG